MRPRTIMELTSNASQMLAELIKVRDLKGSPDKIVSGMVAAEWRRYVKGQRGAEPIFEGQIVLDVGGRLSEVLKVTKTSAKIRCLQESPPGWETPCEHIVPLDSLRPRADINERERAQRRQEYDRDAITMNLHSIAASVSYALETLGEQGPSLRPETTPSNIYPAYVRPSGAHEVTDYGGGPDGEEYVRCPGCGKKAIIRSW